MGGKGTRHRCVRLRGHVFPFYLFCLFFCLPSAFLGYVFCSLFSPSLLWPPPVSASVQQPDPSFKQRTLLDGKHGPSLRDTWQWKKKKRESWLRSSEGAASLSKGTASSSHTMGRKAWIKRAILTRKTQ